MLPPSWARMLADEEGAPAMRNAPSRPHSAWLGMPATRGIATARPPPTHPNVQCLTPNKLAISTTTDRFHNNPGHCDDDLGQFHDEPGCFHDLGRFHNGPGRFRHGPGRFHNNPGRSHHGPRCTTIPTFPQQLQAVSRPAVFTSTQHNPNRF